MKIFVVTAEYSHGEDDRRVGGEGVIVISAFTTESAANKALASLKESGEWGAFSVKKGGWSDAGWWLTTEKVPFFSHGHVPTTQNARGG